MTQPCRCPTAGYPQAALCRQRRGVVGSQPAEKTLAVLGCVAGAEACQTQGSNAASSRALPGITPRPPGAHSQAACDRVHGPLARHAAGDAAAPHACCTPRGTARIRGPRTNPGARLPPPQPPAQCRREPAVRHPRPNSVG